MMNTTTTSSSSFANRLANYRAAQAARAASVRYADYVVLRNGRLVAKVSFPNDPQNANFDGVCFYDAATDTFRGDTEVEEFFIKRVL
jgi:hypothetical protein